MLTDKIKLSYPAIWVKDSDPYRVLDIITSTVDRTFYTIDYENGFSQYIEGEWKPILVPNPAEESVEDKPFVTTWDRSIALEYIEEQHDDLSKVSFIIFVFSHPEHHVSSMLNSVYNSLKLYRNAFWKDNLTQIPLQQIVISPHGIPAELHTTFSFFGDMIPTHQELVTIVNHINSHANDSLVKTSDIKEVASAGLGLSEMSFIGLCLDSVIQKSNIDAKFIYDTKMKEIKDSGILEIIKPQITFDNIGGLDNIKDIIRRTSFLRENNAEAQKYGISPIRRMLMVGVPGTGKSAICQATAAELGLDLARTGISQVMNKYIGQSEENMRAVFQQIKAMDPLCVWIDEFGRDLSGSGQGADSGTTDRVHGEFLTGLQELPQNSFLLCAANELENLKPEMLRADRFDKIFFVGLPSHEERKHIFNIYLSQIETDHSYDYDALAESTTYMTGAEIVSLIKEVKFFVVSESMRPINTSDILKHAPTIKNTIWQKHPDMVKSMYQYALSQWDWASSQQQEEAHFIISGRTRNNNNKLLFT